MIRKMRGTIFAVSVRENVGAAPLFKPGNYRILRAGDDLAAILRAGG